VVVEQYLEEYNLISNAPMKLVLFLDAIEHTSRVCRVIGLPLGNALLLGVGGSGRQSLTKLATFMEEFELFQVGCTTLFLFFLIYKTVAFTLSRCELLLSFKHLIITINTFH
jgi:hypothetical protein